MEERHMEHIPREEVAVYQSKTKILLFLITAFVLCLFMSACYSSYDLKKAQIPDLKVYLCSEDNNDYIIISGTPYHSALVIKKIIINDHGNSINIEAEQQLCGSGIGLLFYLKIQIRKNISTITLGQENEIIWERGVKGK